MNSFQIALGGFSSFFMEAYRSFVRALTVDRTDLVFLAVNVVIFIAVAIIVQYLLRKIRERLQKKIDEKSLLNLFFKHGVFVSLAYVVPLVLNYYLAGIYHIELFSLIVERLTSIVIIVFFMISVNKALSAFNSYYRSTLISKNIHLTGLFQILQIFVIVISFTLIVSIIVDKSVFVLLSGVGALTAAVLFLFRETFLSILASFQIQMDHTLKQGDWIELPNQKITGFVENITLFVVKIRGSDNSMTYLPVKTLIDQSYQNYKNVELSGARRIVHKIAIRPDLVHVLSEEDLEKIVKDHENDPILKTVLEKQKAEGKKMLNLSIFRKYLIESLKADSMINADYPTVIRYYDQDSVVGIPVEIYTFSTQTTLKEYLSHKADIVEKALSSLEMFHLESHSN